MGATDPSPAYEAVVMGTAPLPPLLYCLVVRKAADAIPWYEKALKAKTISRYEDKEDGRVMHCTLESEYGIKIAVEDHYPDLHQVKPIEEGETGNGVPAVGCSYLYITIPEEKGITADDAVELMRKHGAKVVKECKDMFYGHRVGQVVDMWGVVWAFASSIEGSN